MAYVFLMNNEDIEQFSKDLIHESDRGCALIAGAWLEDELGRLLKAFFVEPANKDMKARLWGATGTVATFSSRIDLCYALGHLTTREHHNLHTIRKIRNCAAHLRDKKGLRQWPADGFSNDKIAKFVNDLKWHSRALKILKSKDTPAKSYTKREAFGFMVGLMLAILAARAEQVQRCTTRTKNMLP